MEFEALLMDNPEVQQDERWAFLWNPRSVGGRWYRWRLYELKNRKAGISPPHKMFDNSATWRRSERKLRFEDCTSSSDMLGHPDDDPDNENGWDEDEVEEDANGDMVTKKGGREYLDPYRIGLLWMLIHELPETHANLIEGDVKSITDFALIHAEKGALEVVDALVSHIEILYNQTMDLFEQSKNKVDTGQSNQLADKESNQLESQHQESHEKADSEAVNDSMPQETIHNLTDDLPKPQDRKDREDPSAPIIVAFNVIHDIVTQGKTAGVTRAVRYGEYFQNAFETRELFSKLGRLDRDLKWGRIRADRWKRQVIHFLDLWAEESAVPHLNRLKDRFENPPLTEEEERLQEERKKEDEAKKRLVRIILDNGEEIWEDIDGEPMDEDDMDYDDLDRIAITEEDMKAEEDIDGTPMEEDIDGEPMKMSNYETGLEQSNGGEAVRDNNGTALTDASRQPGSAQQAGLVRISFARSRAAKVEVVKPTAPGLFGDEDE
jgi:U2-associated protein SR140